MRELSPTLCLFLIVLAGVIGAKALLHPGFYTSHDGEHQLVRQYIFEQGLKDRQIPVRYSRQLYNGYGYPLFFFTYRLPFYIGEIFRIIGFSFADSIRAVFVVTYVASGLAMFLLARKWGNLAGLLAAVIYLWTPYRFSVMFVRSALGEHAALVFYPLILWTVDFRNKSRIKIPIGGAAIAGLILSHAMMAQIFIFVLSIWLIWQIILIKERRKFVFDSIKIAALGLGLSAFYLLPATAYRHLTQKLNVTYFSDHFVTLRQLVYSPWGYAFSMPGIKDDGMSFQVGIANWLLVFFSLIFLMKIFLVIRLPASPEFKQGVPVRQVRKGSLFTHSEGWQFITMFAVAVFLMTNNSEFIWQGWKNIINIDIPWRYLSVTTLSSSLLAGWLIGRIINVHRAVGLAALITAIAFYGNRNHLRVNKYIDFPDEILYSYAGTSNSYNEYRPRWDDANVAATEKPEALISTGSGELSVVKSQSNQVEVAVRSEEKTRVDINTLYFPGWSVFIDGQAAPFKYAGEGGIMRIDVSEGTHLVQAIYRETRLAKLADSITLGTLAWLGYRVYRLWQQKKLASLS